MKRLVGWLGRGLIAVVPIVLSLIAVVWIVTTLERALAPAMHIVVGREAYVPGAALVLTICLLVAVGAFVDAFAGAWLLHAVDRFFDRIPIVKTVYGSVRDFLRFVVPGEEDQQAKRVVAWQPREGAWIVGFVTGPPIVELARASDEELVSVYFPMSYQVGGYTLLLPRAQLTDVDVSVEDAMKGVLTAGVARNGDQSPGSD